MIEEKSHFHEQQEEKQKNMLKQYKYLPYVQKRL